MNERKVIGVWSSTWFVLFWVGRRAVVSVGDMAERGEENEGAVYEAESSETIEPNKAIVLADLGTTNSYGIMWTWKLKSFRARDL